MGRSLELCGSLSGEEARTLVPGQDLDVAAWLRDLGLERYAQAGRGGRARGGPALIRNFGSPTAAMTGRCGRGRSNRCYSSWAAGSAGAEGISDTEGLGAAELDQ